MPDRRRYLWEADLRHEGQATELTVHSRARTSSIRAALRRRISQKVYGYSDTTPIELMKVRVVGRGQRAHRLDFAAYEDRASPGAALGGSRRVSFERGSRPV